MVGWEYIPNGFCSSVEGIMNCSGGLRMILLTPGTWESESTRHPLKLLSVSQKPQHRFIFLFQQIHFFPKFSLILSNAAQEITS